MNKRVSTPISILLILSAFCSVSFAYKIIIIDKQIVITGSFNFSKAAEESNAENLLILRNPELAAIYLDNWQKHRAHSEKLAPRY